MSNSGRLSPEMLSRAINHLDHAPTLFSLLTVNRLVFHLAVKQLYRLVFNLPALSKAAVRGYITLVLSLSPVNTKALQMLRHHFDIPWPRTGPPPFIDYLALLTDARFDPNPSLEDIDGWKQGPPSLLNLDLRVAILWAVCAHRLSDLTALNIKASDLRMEPFLLDAHLPKYHALQRVEFRVFSAADISAVHDCLKRFIKANPRAKQLDVVLLGASMDNIAQMRTIARLLDPPRSPHQLDLFNLVPCHTHRKTVDFDQVYHVRMLGYPSPSMKEEHLLKDLLPVCPNLESFVGNVSDPRVRMFGWAMNKPESTTASGGSSSSSTKKKKKTPSLRHVRFMGESLPALVAIDDVLRGFPTTLKELTVDIIDNLDFAKDHFSMKRIGAGCAALPRLSKLCIDNLVPNVSVTLDPQALPDLPALEVLELNNPGEAPEEGMQYSDMLHEMYPIAVWPVLQTMHKLTHLALGGRAAAEFHPGSFVHMPCLKSITLGLLYDDWHAYWPAHLWTWDWPMPALTSLSLEGAMTSAFPLTALQHLPRLESLRLRGCHDWKVAKRPQQAQDSSSTVFDGAVKKVEVRGGETLDLTVSDWEQLIGEWFPNAEEITVETRRVSDPEVVRRAVSHLVRLRKLSLTTTDYYNTGMAALVDAGWDKMDVDPHDWQYDEEESEWPKMVPGEGRMLCRLNEAVYHLAKHV